MPAKKLSKAEKKINIDRLAKMTNIAKFILIRNRLPRTDAGCDVQRENAITLERLRHQEYDKSEELQAFMTVVTFFSLESEVYDQILRYHLPEFFAIPFPGNEYLSFVDAVKISKM